MSIHRLFQVLLVSALFCVACADRTREVRPDALANASKFSLEVGLEGAIAFVPDDEASPREVKALLVNTSTGKVSTKAVLKHVPALRFRVNHLFPADEVEVPNSFAVIPLQGDISFSSCASIGTLALKNRKNVPKLKDFVSTFGTACKDCTSTPDKVPANIVASRITLSGGDVSFVKEIKHPVTGSEAHWCFGPLTPQGKCQDNTKVRVIAQRAETKLECTGDSMTVEVLPFGASQTAKKLKLFPRSGKLAIEILNILPGDIADLDLKHSAMPPLNELPHFLWYYTVAGKPVNLGHAILPLMEEPVSGGKPYCSFVELQRDVT